MDTSSDSIKETSHGNVMSYVIGFTISIILTLLAYMLVNEHVLNGTLLYVTIAFIALVQVAVQLYFFLHVGDEAAPYWNLMAFLFMLMVVVIIVGGSLWIMHNLNYRTMTEVMTE